MTSPLTQFSRIACRVGGTSTALRTVPEEAAVALSYGGTTHAVMMATPADLHDFALGFSLTEGIVSSPDEIDEIEVQDLGLGFNVQIRLKDAANKRFEARRRRLAGPVGCGLCGIESIEEAMRDVPSVAGNPLHLNAQDIVQSVQLLSERQILHKQTGAVHAAGFYVPAKGIIAAREDVGRHNALDKLAGTLSKAKVDGTSGAVVITSRVSVEMVQKSAAVGAPIVIAVSAPTALAIRTAEDAGITLVALVRGQEFDIFTHPERASMKGSSMSHEAGNKTGEEKLIYMANQIADSLQSIQPEQAADVVADHINKFWEPRMRRHLFEIIERGGDGLKALVLDAAPKVKRPRDIQA